MPKDFSGQNLQGRSFKGQDLTGANFSKAKIQGANFADSKLEGANFSKATCGLTKRWTVITGTFLLFVSAVLGVVIGVFGIFVGILLSPHYSAEYSSISSILTLITCFLLATTTIRYGLGISLAIFLLIFMLLLLSTFINPFWGMLAVAGANTFAFISYISSSLVFAVARVRGRVWKIVSPAITSAISISIIHIVTIVAPFETSSNPAFRAVFRAAADAKFVANVGAVLVLLLSFYIAKQALSGDEKFTLIRKYTISLTAIGGTSFYKADLTDANFNEAVLDNSDFSGSQITRVFWKDSRHLNYSKLGQSYLANPDLLTLLVTGEAEKISLEGQDLRGINLNNAVLNDVSFLGSDLTNATLRDSRLFEVNLSRSNLHQVDLSNANLTGAYLEKAGFTNTTKLDGLRGDYVHMSLPVRGNREVNRFPPKDQGNFDPGGLRTFIQSLVGTIDLYHGKDFDPRAVVIAIGKVSEEVKEDFQIVALEKTKDGQVIVKVKAADHVKPELLTGSYYPIYQKVLPTLPADKQKMPSEFPQLADSTSALSTIYDKASRSEELQPVTININMTENYNPQFHDSFTGNFASKLTDSASQQFGQNNYDAEQKPLDEAAAEIQRLLKQLEDTNPTATEPDQIAYVNVATKPELRQRVIAALQEGGETAIDEFMLGNKYLKVGKAVLKGWCSPKI